MATIVFGEDSKTVEKFYQAKTIDEAKELFKEEIENSLIESGYNDKTDTVDITIDSIEEKKKCMKKEEDDDGDVDVTVNVDKDDDEDDEDDKKMEKKKIKESEITIPGSVLESFSTEDKEVAEKFQESFKLTVANKVNEILETHYQESEEILAEKIEKVTKKQEKLIDKYLSHVTEEWLKENEIAIEESIQANLNEEFLVGLQSLFNDHYVNVPKEKEDIVESLNDQVSDLKEKLNDQLEKNIDLSEQLEKTQKYSLIETYCDKNSFSDVKKEKIVELSESIDFDGNQETFERKLETLISTIDEAKEDINDKTDLEKINENMKKNDLSTSMQKYINAL
jgi:hypothetical protein